MIKAAIPVLCKVCQSNQSGKDRIASLHDHYAQTLSPLLPSETETWSGEGNPPSLAWVPSSQRDRMAVIRSLFVCAKILQSVDLDETEPTGLTSPLTLLLPSIPLLAYPPSSPLFSLFYRLSSLLSPLSSLLYPLSFILSTLSL